MAPASLSANAQAEAAKAYEEAGVAVAAAKRQASAPKTMARSGSTDKRGQSRTALARPTQPERLPIRQLSKPEKVTPQIEEFNIRSSSSLMATSNGAPNHGDIQRAVIGALLAGGMKETAANYRAEVGLEGSDTMDVTSAMEILLQPDVIPAEVAAVIRRSLTSGVKAPPALSLAETSAHMAEQCSSMDRLQQKLRALRMQGANFAPLETSMASQEYDGDNDKLKSELEQYDAEIRKLRSQLEERQAAEKLAQERLRKVKAELADLEAQPAPPKPKPRERTSNELMADKIRGILSKWDTSAIRRRCTNCFAKVDSNHDGRLEWNPGEIKKFVKLVFQTEQVPLPPWQETIWYEMYRRCDVDGSYSLDLEEAFRFAKTCLETALTSLDSAQPSSPGGQESEGHLSARSHHSDPPLSARAANGVPPSLHTVAQAAVARAAERATVQEPVMSMQTAASEGTIDAQLANIEAQFKARCQRCFVEVDANHDGFLSWQATQGSGTYYEDETRAFVGRLFEEYGVSRLPFQENVWNDLFAACGISRDYLVDFEHAHQLAKRGFDLLPQTPRV